MPRFQGIPVGLQAEKGCGLSSVLAFRHRPVSAWAASHLEFIDTAAQQLAECLHGTGNEEFAVEMAEAHRLADGNPPHRLVLAVYEREAEMRRTFRPANGAA